MSAAAEAKVVFQEKQLAPGKVLLEFRLAGPITPEEAAAAVEAAPEVSGPVLLLLSGRGPIWLYGMLIHKYMHNVAAVATYDPKLGGYVVVASHSPVYKPGMVVRA